jgi:hypothetical protein
MVELNSSLKRTPCDTSEKKEESKKFLKNGSRKKSRGKLQQPHHGMKSSDTYNLNHIMHIQIAKHEKYESVQPVHKEKGIQIHLEADAPASANTHAAS